MSGNFKLVKKGVWQLKNISNLDFKFKSWPIGKESITPGRSSFSKEIITKHRHMKSWQESKGTNKHPKRP